MAYFVHARTQNSSKTFKTIHQVLLYTVKRKFKVCECKIMSDNNYICNHCYFKEFRLDKISLDQKIGLVMNTAHYRARAGHPGLGNSYPDNIRYCDCCGATGEELYPIPYGNLRVCKTCKTAGRARR